MPIASSNPLQGACAKSSHQCDQAFSGLKGEASARLKAIGMEMNCSVGTTIFVEGQAAHSVYILRSGRIKLSVTSREGKTVILRIAEAGQVISSSVVSLVNRFVQEFSSKLSRAC
jgi:CRP/FNR family transcriptional regulator